MCGICGVVRLDREGQPVSCPELERTRDAMAPRGPDGSGMWISSRGDVGLAHRRLAIIDLTPAAAQPMVSADGRWVIVFNGEIYNHKELRAEIEAHGRIFRSSSDTEVLLALYERDGPEMLRSLRGMYAFAVWDEQARRLFMARDPYGIKPLYYSVHGGQFRFASQVKALEASGAIPDALDPAGLVGFLLWGSVPEPTTLRREIRALPAGYWLEVADGKVGRPRRFYRLGDATAHREVTAAAAVEDSVRSHLVSDVPVGIFLSAGLDSAMLAGAMRRHCPEPPLAFTLAFEEFRGTPLDEAPGATFVAQALGLRHVVRRGGQAELEDLWALALQSMDQPSIDGFNVFVVSHFAKEAGLKVVLSGLGGDEVFGSYPSFRDVPAWRRWARRGRRMPCLERAWDRLAPTLAARWPKLPGLFRYGETLSGAYYLKRGLFLPEEIPALIGPALAEEGLSSYDPRIDAAKDLFDRGVEDEWTVVHRMESSQYLRNQLLRDADWASMAHSLELRVPFVDTILHEALWAGRFEPARSSGKSAIARIVAPEIPELILKRSKSGFMLPWTGARNAPTRPPAPWSRQARRLAVDVLASVGIELRLDADPGVGPRKKARRGGTVFVVPEAFRRPGGIQTHNRTQIQALRQSAPKDCLSILVLNDAPDDVLRGEWTGLHAKGYGRRKIRLAFEAAGIVRGQRPQRIILGHRNLLLLAPFLHFASSKPEIWLLIYGVDAQRQMGSLERRWMRSVGRVFAISPQTAEAFKKAGCSHAVDLWPCSLPPSFEMPEPAPTAFGRPLRLLSVSRLAKGDSYKGIDVCIRALRLLRDRGVETTLDIAGEGDDRGRIEGITTASGVGDIVRFLGWVDETQLRECYASCDAFVLPSAAEGFGIVYLEALAHSKPVIAAAAGGAPFVVRPGTSGMLVPYGDAEALATAIAKLVEDPEFARELGLRGRAFLLRTFTFGHMIERTQALLKDERFQIGFRS